MNYRSFSRLNQVIVAAVIVAWISMGSTGSMRADDPPPLRVLYLTGGGWHDYRGQERIITEGLRQRLDVEFTIDHTGGTAADHQPARFERDGWHEDFDLVFYNMCFSAVDDKEFVERMCRVHHEHGVPAVFMHCAIHSFRAATLEWFKLGGVRSHRHEGHRPYTVRPIAADHPVMRGFPQEWTTPQGELYEIEEVYDTATPLAQAYGRDTGRDHVVIWTNQYGKARVFGTTIGHHNETVQEPVYLDMISRGVLWAAGRLDESQAETRSETEAEERWVSLFDGRSLEGWRASENPDSFRVQDGVIVVDGPRAHLFYEGPVGDADFKNFELKMDIMTLPRANSGVFFHTRFQESGWPQYGYEAQVNATHGDRIKTGSVYGVQNVMDEAPHEDNEWFNYHIIVQGKQITIKVDGETVNEYTEPDEVRGTRRLSRGTIALQAHDVRSVIHFKNIQIKLLPD